jgi:hypothetical protein
MQKYQVDQSINQSIIILSLKFKFDEKFKMCHAEDLLFVFVLIIIVLIVFLIINTLIPLFS